MLKRQIYSLSRRAYCSASINLGNEIQNAKPFSEIPSLTFFKMVKESLPGGKYYKKSIREITKMFYDEFGDTIRIPAMLGRPEVVVTYNADNFEKVKFF